MLTENTHSTASAVEYFRRPQFRERLRACMLAPYLDDLTSWLGAQGYPRNSIYTILRLAVRLAEFADAGGIQQPSSLTDDLVGRLVASLEASPRTQKEVRNCAAPVMAFLRERDLAPATAPIASEADLPLLVEYAHYLAEHRGIGQGRIKQHRVHVRAFLDWLGPDGQAAIADLHARQVFEFIVWHAEGLGRSARKSACGALRSFLRFLHLGEHVRRDLVGAVPVIPTFKLDRLPRAIAWEDIQKVLAVVDRSTALGRRDYAILLLLATYGMRSGQICALRLDDLDWRNETIELRAVKGGRDTLLPLTAEIGEALVGYLRDGRPRAPFREVFLRVRAPIGPLRGGVTNVVKAYVRKAGLTEAPIGAHAWRHACATRMLAEGESLKAIRDTLGHRSVETTTIYTKVDVEMLRRAALEWPGVES